MKKTPDIQERLQANIRQFASGQMSEQELRLWLATEKELTKTELLGFVMARAKRLQRDQELMAATARIARSGIHQM